MAFPKLRLGTRKSNLALWQANFVKQSILSLYPDCEVKIIGYQTSGDIEKDRPLADIGGKGLFIKELELVLKNDEVDFVVHSMKDVPTIIGQDFSLPVVFKRENPLDVLISATGDNLQSLKLNSTIGTCSPRRIAQIKHFRPDLRVFNLRGNLETRLKKIKKDKIDSIILAAAGLKRLKLKHLITEVIKPSICMPAVAQGIIGIECLQSNKDLLKFLTPLNHKKTYYIFLAERAFLATLQGNCTSPIGAYTKLLGGSIKIEGLVASYSGTKILKESVIGKLEDAIDLGKQLGECLLNKGAKALLQKK